jgi:hypothetical protein
MLHVHLYVLLMLEIEDIVGFAEIENNVRTSPTTDSLSTTCAG